MPSPVLRSATTMSQPSSASRTLPRSSGSTCRWSGNVSTIWPRASWNPPAAAPLVDLAERDDPHRLVLRLERAQGLEAWGIPGIAT